MTIESMGLEWPRFVVALVLSAFISLYGLKKRSLNRSGAVAAVLVGFVLTAANACFCVSLLTFFFTSSRLTKWRGKDKRKLEEEFKEGTYAGASTIDKSILTTYTHLPITSLVH